MHNSQSDIPPNPTPDDLNLNSFRQKQAQWLEDERVPEEMRARTNGAEPTKSQENPSKSQFSKLPLAERREYLLHGATLEEWFTPEGLDVGVETYKDASLWYPWIAQAKKLKKYPQSYQSAVKALLKESNGYKKSTPGWQEGLLCTSSGIPQQTVNNLALAFRHLQPKGWYDLVRERHMIGNKPVEDGDDTAYGIRIERLTQMRVTNIKLVGRAMDHVCRQTTKDLLQEWVNALPEVPVSNLLTTWLRTYGHVPEGVSDAYVADVSRILPVGMIARILKPGCQFRYVVTLEGEEDAGKSELVRTLAGGDVYGQSWYVPLSAGLEGKEAHMMLEGALLAELADLSSYNKTDENRMKALVTLRTDPFIPKFSNKRVDHPRRTIFVATVNPEGDGRYLKGQTGNTRYLPIWVENIDLEGFSGIREQLFAEAKAYYLAHLKDWWALGSGEDVKGAREARRQLSVYEGDLLESWLEGKAPITGLLRSQCTVAEVLDECFSISISHQTKQMQMEMGKALRAYKWHNKQKWHPADSPHSKGYNANIWYPDTAL